MINSAKERTVFFEVNQIELFGGNGFYRRYIKEHANSAVIPDFHLPFEFFAESPESRQVTSDSFIQRCGESNRPIANRMHANFFLGVEALAVGDEKHDEMAADYFEACRDDDGFQLYVYRLSQALLAHRDHWRTWFDR